MARTMAAARGGSHSSADPAPFLVTFFTGQPMLMSMICAPHCLPMQRGLGHHLRLAAEDLQRVRPLDLGVVPQVPHRPGVGAHQPLGAHQLGGAQRRAHPEGEHAERLLAHPRHRGEHPGVLQRIGTEAEHRTARANSTEPLLRAGPPRQVLGVRSRAALPTRLHPRWWSIRRTSCSLWSSGLSWSADRPESRCRRQSWSMVWVDRGRLRLGAASTSSGTRSPSGPSGTHRPSSWSCSAA